MERRLYRSRSDRMIWGVCGGLAGYLNVDPTLVRVVMGLLVLADGVGFLIYIIMAVIVPLKGSKTTDPKETILENVEEIKRAASELGEEISSTFGEEKTEAKEDDGTQRWHHLIGIVLIVGGLLFLAANFNFFWWFDWDELWPLVLVGAGLLFILMTWRRRYE